MTSHVLTPGQLDMLRGTYTADFMNKQLLALAVQAPARLAPSRVVRAMSNTGKTHPALRSHLTDLSSGTLLRQNVDASEYSIERSLLIREHMPSATLREGMTRLVATVANHFDVVAGSTWGLILIHSDDADYVVFVFSHMVCDLVSAVQCVRTFIRSYCRDALSPHSRDTYLEYLRELEAAWNSAPSDEVLWWQNRPWAEVSKSPNLGPIDPSTAFAHSRWEQTIHQRQLAARGLTELILVSSMERSVRETTGISAIRIDAAVHGRDTRIRRAAGGWISHALPYVFDSPQQSTHLRETTQHARSWPAAFGFVRNREDLSIGHHLGAHAFVNFFGSFDPGTWSMEGFRASPVQPGYTPPSRSSLTPLHLKVRRKAQRWIFAWSMASPLSECQVFRAIADRTVQILAEKE